MDKIRLRVRVGDREFEAEGPPNDVETRWQEAQHWLFQKSAEQNQAERLTRTAGPADPPDNLFRPGEPTGGVALRVLPPGRGATERLAHALLMLLYAHDNLLKQPSAPTTRLAEELRLSGFSRLQRLSRAFARLENDGFAIRRGKGKGTLYRLTGPGRSAALRLMHGLPR